MAIIINRERWRQQPSGGIYEIDFNHPLVNGLVFSSCPGMDISGFTSTLPLTMPFSWPPAGGNGIRFNLATTGMCFKNGGSGLAIQYTGLTPFGTNAGQNYTLMTLAQTGSATGRKQPITISDEASGAFPAIMIGLNLNKSASTTAGVMCHIEQSSGTKVGADSNNSQVDGLMHLYQAVRTGTASRVYRDGVDVTSTQTTSATTITLNAGAFLGSKATSSAFPDFLARGWAFNRSLELGELEAWADNPWQDHKLRTRRFWVPKVTVVARKPRPPIVVLQANNRSGL